MYQINAGNFPLFAMYMNRFSALFNYTHTISINIGLVCVSEVRSNPINIKNKTPLEIVFPIKQNMRTIFMFC